VELKGEGDAVVVAYDLMPAEPVVEVDGLPFDVQVHRIGRDVVDATVAGVRRRYQVALLGTHAALVDSALGASRYDVVDPLPQPDASGPRGGLTAPMPGLVVRVLVQAGDLVEAGRPLLVMEAMKMEHTILNPHDGVVQSVAVSEGDQVERGAVLAAVEEESA